MIFSSPEFVIFFFGLIVSLYVFKNAKETYKKIILIAASYFFYGYWDWRLLWIIALITLFNFFIGGRVYIAHDFRRKIWLLFSIIFNIAVLAYFKYYNFFIDSITDLLHINFLSDVKINTIIPIGISFYIFQTITYCVDIHKGKIEPSNFIDFALFVAFFPKLIVGPISTAAQFLPQLKMNIKLTKENFLFGSRLFLIGWFKKVLLANSLTIFVDEVFGNIAVFDAVTMISAVLAYSFQIYYDFSGYSDMAIGIARILGISLPDNFNYPYKSRNITEFWRRWHISLSTWIRDYLYIPLGGNRLGKIRAYINIFITMGLCGLWHGAGVNFIIWGMMHGSYLIVHKLYSSLVIGGTVKQGDAFEKIRDMKRCLLELLNIGLTYSFVCLGWIFFRAKTMQEAILYVDRIFNSTTGVHWIHISFYLIVPLSLIWHIMPNQFQIKYQIIRFDTYPGMTVSIALIMLILLFSPLAFAPFIYFQF